MTKRWVWALIAIGVAVRVAIALGVTHNAFDLESVTIVDKVMRTDPLSLYDTKRYPYPPGFVPWILFARLLADHLGAVPFSAWVKLPSILADGALAFVVSRHLAWRGVSARTQVLAAATIAIGPVFVIVSGYEVQLDSVATLPAVLALVVWERRPDWAARGWAVGALLGAGAALKTAPLLLVIAFLPTARSWGERLRIVVPAVGIPLALLAPWLVADFGPTTHLLQYSGIPGGGGLSLVTQPALAKVVMLTHSDVRYGSAADFFLNHGGLVFGPFYVAVALVLVRWRVDARAGCVAVWLAFYAFAPNFFFQYLVWGIPFFLLGGYVVVAAAFVALIALPHALFVARPWQQSSVATIYAVCMIGAWVGYVVALVAVLRRAIRGARHHDVSDAAPRPSPSRR